MTQQATDRIVIDDVEYPLYGEPLSKYLDACAPTLDFCNRPSFNWRGYVAEWEILDGNLYLAGIFGDIENDTAITVKSLFPFSNGQVHAIWFTGELVLPVQERTGNNGRSKFYTDRYQKELCITLQRGKVIKTLEQDIPCDRASLPRSTTM